MSTSNNQINLKQLGITLILLMATSLCQNNKKIPLQQKINLSPTKYIARKEFWCIDYHPRNYRNVNIYLGSLYVENINGTNTLYYGPTYGAWVRLDYRQKASIHHRLRGSDLYQSEIERTKLLEPHHYYVLNDIRLSYEDNWKIYPLELQWFWVYFENLNIKTVNDLLNIQRRGVDIRSPMQRLLDGVRFRYATWYTSWKKECHALRNTPDWTNWYNGLAEKLRIGAYMKGRRVDFSYKNSTLKVGDGIKAQNFLGKIEKEKANKIKAEAAWWEDSEEGEEEEENLGGEDDDGYNVSGGDEEEEGTTNSE